MKLPIKFSGNLQKEISSGNPVVALESTIITHGMPWPQNFETAKAVEHVIRQRGATPATIAVLEGVLCIGLDEAELEALALTKDASKLSTADLPYCLVSGTTGSTTVAATMCAAHHAGIKVFATGGIGGVHRDVDQSFDISADLSELSRTPVTVVCAGAKAILDLPKTFEALETMAVPVIAWRSDFLPAFWSSQSTLQAPLRFDRADQIAGFLHIRQQMDIRGGVLVCNPVPEELEIPFSTMEKHIIEALQEAEKQGIKGKQVTPFLLQQIFRLTQGASLETNIHLIKNNAALAADLATAIKPSQVCQGTNDEYRRNN